MKSIALIGLCVLVTGLCAAAELKSGISRDHMDTSVRPQDDIYLAIVGKWLATAEIPADKSNYGAFIQLDDLSRDRTQQIIQEIAEKEHPAGSEEQKIRDMYLSFMDEAGIQRRGLEPIKADLAAVDAIRTHDDVVRAFATFTKVGIQGPFSFSAEIDAKDPQRYLATFAQGGLTLPDRDYYLLQDARYLEARAAYVTYATRLFVLSGEEEARANEAAEKILALETRLAEGQSSRTDLRDPVRNYNRVSLTELATLAPGYPWAAYLSELGLKEEHVNIAQPSFAQAVATLLTSTPVDEWRAYIKLRVLNGFASALTKEFEQAHFQLHGKTLGGIPQQKSRQHRAVDAIGGGLTPSDFGVLGDAVGRVYVGRYFPSESKARMDALVKNLLKAYQQSIESLNWMSAETKKNAQDKLSKYRVKIGYTEKWRDYNDLQIRSDDLIANLKSSSHHKFNRYRKLLADGVDAREWSMTPQTVNAYYSPPRNEIVFPAAILQPPFFNPEADDAVNYGAIGAVIGHEISHGFDDKGSKYDGNGALRNWWTDEDRKRFEEHTAKLVAQYSNYEVLPGKKLNGQLTVGENIADLSGLSIAYKAYKLSLNGKEAPVIDGWTGDQRFFLGWAQAWRRKYRDADLARRLVIDVHSPSHFRAIGAPINIDAFHQAFSTKPGDKMYKAPEERIRIW